MDFSIDIDDDGRGAMTFDRAETIMNNLYLSLTIERGSWFFDPAFGSRLHLLQRAKNTEKTAALARDYCREALQWLIDLGRVTELRVSSERDRLRDPNRLKLLVEATRAGGETLSYLTFVEVV